jgi:hypothetical protein
MSASLLNVCTEQLTTVFRQAGSGKGHDWCSDSLLEHCTVTAKQATIYSRGGNLIATIQFASLILALDNASPQFQHSSRPLKYAHKFYDSKAESTCS